MEKNPAKNSNMGGPGEHNAKRNMLGTQRETLYSLRGGVYNNQIHKSRIGIIIVRDKGKVNVKTPVKFKSFVTSMSMF